MAVISDAETDEKLLETVVLEHHQEVNSISIADRGGALFGMNRVSVVIICDSTAYSFSGNIRRTFTGQLEIALFKCVATPIRSQGRFTVNSEAWVMRIDEPKSFAARHLPFKVYFINISATGALLEPLHESFEVGEVFTMRMPLQEKDAIIKARVLRREQKEGYCVRYGCKFLSVE